MLLSEASQAKLDELRGSGDFSRIEISSDYAYSWDIVLTWSDVSDRRPSDISPWKPVRPCAATRHLDDVVDAAYQYWWEKTGRGPSGATGTPVNAEMPAQE